MNLQELFDSFSIEDLKELVSSCREEDLHLEFKTVHDARLQNKDDKKNLAIALSGFANSDGGLLIWGVQAHKNSDGVDCASKLIPISNLQRFINRLNTLTGEAVTPLVEGVQHKPIHIDENSGCVITLVPASLAGPHMARLGENRYYKRSGDSFYRMEHFDIADMFGRRRKPRLSLTTRITRGGATLSARGTTHHVFIIISIINEGRGSAKAPFLRLEVNPPFKIYPYGIDGNGTTGLPELSRARDDHRHSYGASADFLIHPGITVDVTAIQAEVSDADLVGLREFPDITIKYLLTAEDCRPQEGTLFIKHNEILKAVG